MIDGIGDVGDDVLLDLTGADPDPLPVGGLTPVRRHLVTGGGRLPGEEGAGAPVPGRLPTCAVETPIAVAEMGPGQVGLGHREIGHREDVGVPEHVMAIAIPGEEAGPHSRPLRGPWRSADEMECGKTEGLLGVGVAGDFDLARLPAPGPFGGRGGSDLIEAFVGDLIALIRPLVAGVLGEAEPLPRRQIDGGAEPRMACVMGHPERAEATNHRRRRHRCLTIV